MKLENTKWGSILTFKNGFYIKFNWKAYFLVLSITIIIIKIVSYFNWCEGINNNGGGQ